MGVTNDGKQPGERQLKIYPKHFARTYDNVVFPEIRLCGKWLKESGFNSGQAVKVCYEKNKIVITIDDQQ